MDKSADTSPGSPSDSRPMVEDPSDIGNLLQSTDYNRGAMATTLSYLNASKSYGLFDKWMEVECDDGTKARILKNPNDAFQIYATEWSTKFNAVADVLNQVKVEADAEVNNKIAKLFDNLNYVEATLREMYHQDETTD
jgi:hypothetical protein